MNEEQIKAIESVERAMKKLKKSGLALCGIDCDLVAVVAKDFHYASSEMGVTSLAKVADRIGYEVIDCPYIDSGGA